jgi:predicted translin family RNA/ssDNA-binding protein
MIEMIMNNEFRRFEIEILRNEKLDVKKKFKIVEALYKEAVALGVFPLKDSLEGLEVDIRIAKVINSVSKDT